LGRPGWGESEWDNLTLSLGVEGSDAMHNGSKALYKTRQEAMGRHGVYILCHPQVDIVLQSKGRLHLGGVEKNGSKHPEYVVTGWDLTKPQWNACASSSAKGKECHMILHAAGTKFDSRTMETNEVLEALQLAIWLEPLPFIEGDPPTFKMHRILLWWGASTGRWKGLEGGEQQGMAMES